MKIGIIQFPGSNCDRDALTAAKAIISGVWPEAANVTGSAEYLWHKNTSLPKLDLIIVPGGFSYGDYLRSGAMAAHSPILQAVKKHAGEGRLVMGICNGFQILTESGLLPGVLTRNQTLSFVCRTVHLRVENTKSPFTSSYQERQVLRIPVAHHDGCYFADDNTLKSMEDNGQILFRYCRADGSTGEDANPNGSLHHIAGVTNAAGNVMGMMPHPERACDPLTGSSDGRGVFTSLARIA